MYVNVSDNATFHIQVNQFQFVHRIHLYRMMESRSRIATVSFPSGDWNSTYVTKNGIKYRDRILTATVNVTTGLRIIYLTIADIQPDDNGTYMIQPRFDWFPIGVNETCFKLYVLGR